jgi:ferredoxin-NADP reductase
VPIRDAEFLRDRVEDRSTPLFDLAGPPGLVGAVTKALVEANVDLSRVQCEEFAGY